MSLDQFLSIVAARWKVMLAIFLLTVGTTVGISFMLPKQYSASAAVLVDIKSPDPLMGMLYPSMLAPSYMATQVDVIQSDRVARRVVRTLKLTSSPESREQWLEATKGQGDIESWLAGALQKRLDVKPSKESNVISVSFKAVNPRFAMLVADAFVQAYIDTLADLRAGPAKQYTTFFDARANQLRDQLESAQQKLSAFQRERGISATDERFDIETARLQELSGQLVNTQTQTAEASSRRSQAGRSADQMQEVLNNAVVSGLRSEVSRQEAKLQELNARYGERHPAVVEARASLTEVRGRLDAEIRRVGGSVEVSSRIAQQREAEVRAAFEAQRAKVLKIKAQRDESAVLIRDVENAQRAYDQMLQRVSQTSLESQNTLTNVSVLNTATEPNEPSSPKIALNSAISVVMGVLLALGAALALEFLNRRVRTAEDVAQAIGLPVIGILPDASRRLGGRRVRPPMLVRRVLGELPAPPSRAA
jgi:succinoglycan biosynthesis transport protein ExoP